MKKILALLVLTSSLARAAVVYSGVQNINVPVTFDGVYVNLFTGATATTQPGSWTSAPWINPFFGGVDIGTSLLLRPVILGGGQIVNLAPGLVVSASSNFAPGESGSTTHVGPAIDQFHFGTPGYLGFVFQTALAGPSYYGWGQLTIDNAGSGGTLVDWAYEDVAGTAIAVPEPGRAALFLAGLGALGLIRRRTAHGRGKEAASPTPEGQGGPAAARKGRREGSCGRAFGKLGIGLNLRGSAFRGNFGTFSGRAGLKGMDSLPSRTGNGQGTPVGSPAGRATFRSELVTNCSKSRYMKGF